MLQVILSSYDSRWIIMSHISITCLQNIPHSEHPKFPWAPQRCFPGIWDSLASLCCPWARGRRTEWQNCVNSAPQFIYWHNDFAGLSGWEFNLAGLNFTLSSRTRRCLSTELREKNLLVKVEFQRGKLNNTCKCLCYLLICNAWPP